MWCRKGWSLAKWIGQMPDGTICRQTETYSAICVQGSCRVSSDHYFFPFNRHLYAILLGFPQSYFSKTIINTKQAK